ncbi:hypothetical protein [Streptomyces sp. NPDC056296]|uniref:hypothetical protein n=1 Tax=Streptomyces sp. NPDC056296 TaxID=3345775 RepID=UPI0035DB38A7
MRGATNSTDYRPRFLNLDLGTSGDSTNVALKRPATASSADDAGKTAPLPSASVTRMPAVPPLLQRHARAAESVR